MSRRRGGVAPAARCTWRPVPTGRLAALAAVGALAVLALPGAGWWSLAAVNGVVLALAGVDLLRGARLDDLAVERSVPAIIPLDAEAELGWTLRSRAGRRAHVRLADAVPPSLGAAERRAAVVVEPGGRTRAATTVRPTRRGRFDLGPVTVRAHGPWRLAARQGDVEVPGVVRVYPPFRSREEAELRISRARILEVGLRSARGRGGGTEFDQLREYGVDDESRRIDWAATARSGKPIVRTYRAERNQTVLVLLDTGRTMAGRVDAGLGDAALDDVPRLDHAMDVAMAVTAVGTRLGDRVGLVAFDAAVRAIVAPGHRRDQLARVTEALYDLQPALVESDYRGAFAEALARFRRRALLVVLTELADEAVGETLEPALPLLLRDHLVLVAAARDPELVRWATAVPTEARTAYRKAAAVQALERRRRLVARLRRRGAVVLDAEPGALAAAVADAYLEVKAAGRL